MRYLLLLLALLAAPAGAQQLGFPMSELPGVETIQQRPQDAPGAIGTRTVEGVSLPPGAIDRLTRLVPGAAGATNAQDVGIAIEQSFYEEVGGARQRAVDAAAAKVNGAWQGTQLPGAGVTVNGVTIAVPSRQDLQASGLIPGYGANRRSSGGTGVSNVFTGTGIPRASDAP